MGHIDLSVTAPKSFRPTSNRFGYSSETLPVHDPVVGAFLDHAETARRPVIDIGAGHGIITAAALRRGATVVANEIHVEHVSAILTQVNPKHKSRLSLLLGAFPEELHVTPGTFDGALVSRVLHFFDGQRIERAARTLFPMLARGGKVFITADTPFRGNMLDFHPIYNARRAAGDPWPGYVDDVFRYMPPHANLPKFMNYLDDVVLARAFAEAGFEIELASLFPRVNIPVQYQLDGREAVGLIARKP